MVEVSHLKVYTIRERFIYLFKFSAQQLRSVLVCSSQMHKGLASNWEKYCGKNRKQNLVISVPNMHLSSKIYL